MEWQAGDGIDGSFLILPNEPGLTKEFCTFSNQKQAISAGARISIAYDVCTHLILEAAIGHTQNDDEKEMVRAHLSKSGSSTDIFVFDRGSTLSTSNISSEPEGNSIDSNSFSNALFYRQN
ncbi:hypothetical protein [Arcticibacter sp. MXS-1]|uniref:hypothetical protein n=1 Tax=Arcticibacter sp. MXS-1 TaxID=3341726 RepID=UPI0035A9A50F